MAQLVRNKETGEYGLYSPDTGVQPISQDEAQVLQQSAAGNIARSVGGALTDAAGSFIEFTLPTILNADGTRRPNIGTRIQEWNDPQQAARRKMRPGQEFAGQALALGAELAVPGGVASKGRRAADAAATPASRGAARGAEMAQQAIEVNRARMPSVAQEGADLAGDNTQRRPTQTRTAATNNGAPGGGPGAARAPVPARAPAPAPAGTRSNKTAKTKTAAGTTRPGGCAWTSSRGGCRANRARKAASRSGGSKSTRQ